MTDNKPTEAGTQRLLRIGTLALTVLGPVINTAAARLADRLERGRKLKVEDVKVVQEKSGKKKIVLTNSKNQATVAVKPSLTDTLQERREALLAELEELIERSTKLSQSLATRGSEVTHDLVERGSSVSQELARRNEEIRKELRKRGQKLNKRSKNVIKGLSKRGEKVAKQLNKRSEKVAKQLSKRGRQATQELSQRSGTFWIVFGFSVGLGAAAIAAYLLIRKRIQQQEQLEEEQSFQLTHNGYMNTNISSSQGTNRAHTPAGSVLQSPVTEERTPAVAVAEQETSAIAAIPADAAFVGVIETRRYYPMTTSLDQIVASQTGKANVVYFTSAEEAQEQGYTAGS